MYEVWVPEIHETIGGDGLIEIVFEYLYSCDTWAESCFFANLCGGTVRLAIHETLDERNIA